MQTCPECGKNFPGPPNELEGTYGTIEDETHWKCPHCGKIYSETDLWK